MAELDSILERAHGEFSSWKYSDPFLCCGYRFKLALARKGADPFVGILFVGSALDFVSLNQGGPFVEISKGTTILVKGCKRIVRNGNSFDDKFMASMIVDGPLHCLTIKNTRLSGMEPLGSVSVLSQCLEEEGYVTRDGHLHLSVELSLAMGIAKCGRQIEAWA